MAGGRAVDVRPGSSGSGARNSGLDRVPTLREGPYGLTMTPTSTDASPTFLHRHRVTYASCTVGNHVYYARYLDLLEEARGEFLRHLGHPFLALQEAGTIFPVIEARLQYRGAARYDDVLSIEVWPTTAARVRLDFSYRILGPDGHLLLEGATRHACTGLDDKPRRLPAALVEALGPYLRPVATEPG